LIRVAGRYIAGRPLNGDRITDATFFRPGTQKVDKFARPSRWSYWAGWKRATVRITVPPAVAGTAYAYASDPALVDYIAGSGAGIVALAGAVRARRYIRTHRFRGTYTRPLARTIAPALNLGDRTVSDSWITISPDFADLAARAARPMSPFELWTRTAYATRVAPVVQWTPDRIRRAAWWAGEHASPVTRRLSWFRRPATDVKPARVEVRIPRYVTEDQKKFIRAAIAAKLGLGDLVEQWDQVGTDAVGMWTLRIRPPASVGYAEVVEYIDTIAEHEFFVGLTAGSRPVVISVDDDAPHIACSAGSGAGKSILAMLLAIQVLRHGGRVLILDRKGSHRWARGLVGVTYCTRPEDMHAALIGAADLADTRNTEAMEHDEGWDPGPRLFVIFEEMNATVAQLKSYWESVREPGQAKGSPAIQAFRDIMYMGRSAKVNLFGIAQMLTAATTGGPEARENFGIRCLARYSANNWKMLAPEAPMPRKSKTRGRWQIVVAGEAIECQVAYLHPAEARTLAEGGVPVSPEPNLSVSTTRGDRDTAATGDTFADPLGELVTLREAVDRGIIGGPYDTAKKRLQRAARPPLAVGKAGRAATYRVGDLIEWEEARTGAPADADQ
jgi:hypothetical protein